MNKIFKPQLAATYDPAKPIKFPVLASPKLDGIRCLIINGVAVSRSLKPIPNQYIQELFGKPELNGLDGELIVGSPKDPNCMQNTTSGVMSRDGKPDVTFWVFDMAIPKMGYEARFSKAVANVVATELPGVAWLGHRFLHNLEDLLTYEKECLAEGYEGIMIRDPDGLYKCGRSTLREGGLIKVKQFTDSEATITGFIEKMHNQNEATKDNLGHTKRSLSKAGMIPAHTLGALSVKDIHSGVEFDIGTGFDDNLRKEIWTNQAKYSKMYVKYKSFPIGVKEAPRFPVFLGFRHLEDMGS